MCVFACVCVCVHTRVGGLSEAGSSGLAPLLPALALPQPSPPPIAPHCREHGFEALLCAEVFQEMLQQRFGRALFRGLAAIDAAKPRSSSSKGDKEKEQASKASKGAAAAEMKEEGKEDGGGKKRDRSASAEPAAADADAAAAAAPSEASPAAAKRQKTDAPVEGAGLCSCCLHFICCAPGPTLAVMSVA